MAVSADAIGVEIVPAGYAGQQSARYLVSAFLLGYREPTRSHYKRSLDFFGEFCEAHGLDPIHDVKRGHIEGWARTLEEVRGNKPATVSNRLAAICSFYKWCEAEEHLEKDPARHVRRPKVDDESSTMGLSRYQFQALMMAAEQTRPAYHALIGLLGLNGLRLSEALGIRIEEMDVQRGHRVIKIRGKGSKIAWAPLAPSAWGPVDSAIGDRKQGTVVTAKGGGPMAKTSAYHAVVRMGKKAGIPFGVHPHQMRHLFVTGSLDAGVDLRDVQISARHVKADTTIRYDRNRHSLDRSAVYRVGPYLMN
jgi:integrase/recombinase XerD